MNFRTHEDFEEYLLGTKTDLQDYSEQIKDVNLLGSEIEL